MAVRRKLKTLFEDPVFMLAVVTAVLFYACCSRDGAVWDNDLFWHIKTGEYIWATKRIPRADPFSWTVTGARWTAHEWLWQALLYAIYARLGWRVVPISASLGVFGILWVLHSLCGPRNAREKTAFEVMMLVLAGIFALFLFSARPQILSYLLFATYLLVLEAPSGRLLWLLPVLQVVWVNSHASFILGIVLPAWALAWAIVQRSQRVKTLCAVLVLNLLACGISPWGYSVLRYPFWVSGNGLMKHAIAEWHSPDFKSPEGLLVAGWLALFCLALSRSSPPAKDVMLAGLFGFMSLQSIRHTPYFVIASTPLVFKWLSAEMPEKIVSARPSKQWAAVTTFSLLTAVATGVLTSPTISRSFPAEAVEYIKNSGLTRVLNYYDWGGYMIWAGVPPFIDGRADIYLETPLFEKAFRFYTVRDDPKALLDEYSVQCVLVPPDTPIAAWLAGNPSWRAVFSDKSALVFIREE